MNRNLRTGRPVDPGDKGGVGDEAEAEKGRGCGGASLLELTDQPCLMEIFGVWFGQSSTSYR